MSNGPSTSSSSSSTSTGNNRLSIAMFILIGLFPFYWFFSKSHLPNLAAPEGPADFTPGASDWYLTVKMPEAPFDSVGMEAYKKTLSAWLAGLQRVGFHPILLSDVYSHANHNAGLPDKAVVLTFEPGYAHTYELAAPILSWYKTPAVWITNTAAIKRSNRKYVSNFRIWRMKHSGQWDVGSYDSPGVLTIQAKQNGKMAFGSASQPTWVTGGKMSYAINQRKAPNRMNRLKTNLDWSDHEFVSRLLSEVPVTGTSQLLVRQVGDRAWGFAMPGTSYTDQLVGLKSPLDKRAVSISWYGTRGLDDFDLQMNAESVVGELWLLIRSDRETGDSVRLGFTANAIKVETEHGGQRKRLAIVPVNAFNQKNNLSASVFVKGSRMTVSIGGKPVLDINSMPTAVANKAILEMMVYSRIRGTAAADNIRMIFTPQTVAASSNPKAG